MPTITEAQIRQMVANQINEWMGATRGSKIHKSILAVYNNYSAVANTPGSYKMSVSDAWCACTVSADVILLGIEKYTGYSISCTRWLDKAKDLGIWTENENIMPKVGDLALYDWDDPAKNYATTDNVGSVEHIGVVTAIDSALKKFYVTEGNMTSASKVGVRVLFKNARYLRGFIQPNYAKIADAINRGEIKYPTVRADGGYNNGSLTQDQVKELQRYHKLTPDGYWGPGCQRMTGKSADEAWTRYKGSAPVVTTMPSTPTIAAKNPYPVPTTTLKQGMSGNSVKWMQFQLWNLKFGTAGKTLERFVDGSFGPATTKSLKAFQTTYGLDPDGSCGPLTREKLKSL